MGNGSPWVSVDEGFLLEGLLEGPVHLRSAVATGRAVPESFVETDVDRDGMSDLITGYGYRGRGIIGVRYGSRTTQQVLADRDVTSRPWSETISLFASDAIPDFLGAGDFDGDGFVDLVSASRSATHLSFLLGESGGRKFARKRQVALDGAVSALATGEINRQDGYPDIVVGIDAGGRGSLVLFEGWHGALTEKPVSLDLEAPPIDLEIAQFDDHYAFDLAVATSAGATIFRGQDRSVLSTGRDVWQPMVRYRYATRLGIVSLAAGNMVGDARNELAMIDGSGNLIIADLDAKEANRTGYRFGTGDANQLPSVRFGNLSSLPGADLIVVDPARSQVHLLHGEHYRTFLPVRLPSRLEESPLPSPRPAPVSFQLPGRPVDAHLYRANGDGADDVMLLLAFAGRDRRSTPTGSVSVVATEGHASRGTAASAPIGAHVSSPGVNDRIRAGSSTPGSVMRPMMTNAATYIIPSRPASTFTVNADGDGWDSSFGDGICATSAGECTFQAAVQESKANPGRDLIDFSISTITATAAFFSIITEAVDILGNSQGRVLFEQPQNIPYGGSIDNVPVKGSTVSALAINGCISVTSDNGGFRFIDNYVGTDRTGNGPAVVGNFVCRHITMDAPDGVVKENVVAGDVRVQEPGAFVVANRIGVRADGSGTVGRGVVGTLGGHLQISGNAFNTQVVNENIVASESSASLSISSVDGTLVEGNFVGVSPLAPGVRMGEGRGIEVTNTLATTIRAGISGRNAIAGNARQGVRLASADSTIVQGSIVANNLDHGIDVFNSFAVLVGGLGADDGNAVIRNSRDGIFIHSIFPVTVQGNFIGVDFDGEEDFGNVGNGISVERDAHVIGAPRTERFGRNIIAFNGENGVHIKGDSVRVVGNYVGTNETGVAMGNLQHGVYIDSDSKDNVVGGANPDDRNVVAYNGIDGVFLWRGSGGVIERNRIFGNEIYDNVELGINLDDNFRENADGVKENDPGDTDTGTNGYQNYPELSVNGDGSLGVRLDSHAESAFRMEYFSNPACDLSGYGEGREFLGADTLTTGTDGIATGTAAFRIFEGQEFVTATATDMDGNTSEFSACAELAPEPASRIRVVYLDGSGNRVPASRQAFQIGRWEPSGSNDPFQWVATEITDDDGVIILRSDELQPGDPFVVRTYVHTEPAVKSNHQDVDDVAYEIFVDNLLVEETGQLVTDELDLNPAASTEVVLSHTTVVFNLLVSLQWKALDSYVGGLEAAFRGASDYLYDVTNGQAQLGKVAIYDNTRFWNSADLRVYANNTLRDNADLNGWKALGQYVRLSPKSFGGGAQDRNKIFREDPLNPNSPDNYRTIVHELGHYLLGFLDEYEDTQQRSVHEFINFGFMDLPYVTGGAGSQAARSEMSMYVDASYMDVAQFQTNGKTSWQQFRDTYSKSYGGIDLPILTPEDYGAPVSDPFIPGPNEFNGPVDYPTGALMGITSSSQASDAAGKVLIIQDAQGNGLRNIDVTLGRRDRASVKPSCFIYQGQTTDRGEIRLLGADVFDQVNLSGDIDGVYFGDAFRIATPDRSNVTVAPAASSGLIGELRSADDADLIVTVSADWEIIDPPDLRPGADCGTVAPVIQESSIAASKRLDTFSWTIAAPGPGESTLELDLMDAAGDSIQTVTQLSVFDLTADSTRHLASAYGFALTLDADAGDVERVAVASSRFPPPRTGLRDSLRMVSRVHNIDVFPVSAALSGRLTINYETQESVGAFEDGITIYRYLNDTWQPVVTTAELLNRRVSMALTEPGSYAAFADLTVTGTATEPETSEVPTTELQLYPNYPNPFSEATVVSFALPEAGRVQLVVYDLLGRTVSILANGEMEEGRHDVTVDGAGLPSGVYVVELRVGERKVSQTMTIVR